MAAEKKNPISFDDIIQADRNKKKNEQLANEIFGRNRHNRDALNKNSRSSSRTGTPTSSLASRVAKPQRSSSTTSTSSQRPKLTPRNSSSTAFLSRSSRISSALTPDQANITSKNTHTPTARGLSIKGKAGPFPVLASNFAPGTTAADIESAVANDSTDSEGQNGLLSCRITATHPSVIAELVFSERTIAERVIGIYDNQRADGRVLRLAHKKTPPTSSAAPLPSSDEVIEDDQGDINMLATSTDGPAPSASDSAPPTSRYDTDREAANRERESSRRGGPAPITGEQEHTDDRESSRPTEPSSDDRNGSGRRDEDRERERDRDHERERDRERDRDRDSHRRYDDRPYERRDDRDRHTDRDRDRERERDSTRRYDNRPAYGGRSSNYGNGVMGMGGPSPMGPRGGYGGGGFRGGRGGGGMYSDGMRGGRGGGRGGYRGDYR